MRRLIDRLLARFGYVVLKTEPRVTAEPTLADACFQFGAREALMRQQFATGVQTARFEAYQAGYAGGEIDGRTALVRELNYEFGFGEPDKTLTRDELVRVTARQLH